MPWDFHATPHLNNGIGKLIVMVLPVNLEEYLMKALCYCSNYAYEAQR